ncbi:MAG: competence protein ComEC family protein [Prevotella sp.]|nr:competence protein ComEC family protein [Prevotella sp.]MCI1281544.1 competence protein ComEC family protein [Prevotella sp.]
MEVNGKIQLYPMLRIALMLILGIVIGDLIGDKVPTVIWVADMIILLIIVNVARNRPILQSITILLSSFFFGVWIVTEHQSSVQVTLPEHEIGYEAVVISEPQVRGKVLLCDLLITSGSQPIKVKASILRDTLTNQWNLLKIGDGIIAKSQLESPRNFYENSNFDYKRWLTVHGFQAQTFIYYNSWTRRQVSLENLSMFERVKIAAMKLRHKLIGDLRQTGLEKDNLALISAMALGDKSMISKEIKQDYSISGGSHILALSGLHLGIIYAVLVMTITVLMRVFRREDYFSSRWVDAVIQIVSLSAIWSYVVLVGMSGSVVRSATMITIYGLVTLLNRQRMSLNALATAAIIMLIINPYNLWDIGFQMSFMAVLGILLIYPHRRLNWFVGITVVSVAAQIGVAPLIMYYFGRFSCYFILTNFIVIPCAFGILYGTIVLLIVSPIAALQGLVVRFLALISSWMNAGVGWIASLPGASIENIHINWVQTLMIYLLMFCAYRIICITLRPK